MKKVSKIKSVKIEYMLDGDCEYTMFVTNKNVLFGDTTINELLGIFNKRCYESKNGRRSIKKCNTDRLMRMIDDE